MVKISISFKSGAIVYFDEVDDFRSKDLVYTMLQSREVNEIRIYPIKDKDRCMNCEGVKKTCECEV